MKILLVNHLLDETSGGGTAERTLQLAKGLSNAGIATSVLTLDIGLSKSRLKQMSGIRLFVLPCINTRYFFPSLSLGFAHELVSKIDVVVLSGNWTILNALIAIACRATGRPYFFAPAGALKPFGRSLWLKRIYKLVVGRTLARTAAVCVAITFEEKSDFLIYGVSEDRIHVIPNGVNIEDYKSLDPKGEASKFRKKAGVGSARYILFLGRLNIIKGPDILLEAFSSLAELQPDIHLILAGPDDGLEAELQLQLDKLGLRRRVHLPGFLQGQMKAAALREADLLVIPSRREAMSIVVLEGGACECPVIFTDTCGLNNLANRGAGVMVDVSPGAIAKAIVELLNDPHLRRTIALRLHEIVNSEYSWAVQAKRHITLAQTVLTGIN